ncbi:MAG: fructose-bisphosphate aldolase [Kiritimatiellales bacterium]|nr:fructose-bisphosphate aldolase [Kiritimatiellales bacterium]
MNRLNFDQTVEAFTSPNNPPHVLAMDQSAGTHEKHMDQFGIEIHGRSDFKKKAAQIRIAMCTTPDLGKYFVGAIQQDDVYTLKGPDGNSLMDHLRNNGVIPIGKKCGLDRETGLIPEADLESLPAELDKLVELGIHMVKIRNTVAALINDSHKEEAAKQMVCIHEMCAQNGQMMPILEPEFILSNPGDLVDNEELMTKVLGDMIAGINSGAHSSHPYVIKTSFPTPGNDCQTESICRERSGDTMHKILKDAHIPTEIQIRFLSGGHPPETSRILYQEMATREGLGNRVGTSFSRAVLEGTYTEAFRKGVFNSDRAQTELTRQGMLNMLAQRGEYESDMEKIPFKDIKNATNI